MFLIDGIAIRFHVCSYFIYVCLDDWCLFGHQWKNFLEVMFKFLWSIILNFWNRVLKIENRIFALYIFILNWLKWVIAAITVLCWGGCTIKTWTEVVKASNGEGGEAVFKKCCGIIQLYKNNKNVFRNKFIYILNHLHSVAFIQWQFPSPPRVFWQVRSYLTQVKSIHRIRHGKCTEQAERCSGNCFDSGKLLVWTYAFFVANGEHIIQYALPSCEE